MFYFIGEEFYLYGVYVFILCYKIGVRYFWVSELYFNVNKLKVKKKMLLVRIEI